MMQAFTLKDYYALLDNRLSHVPFKHEGPDHPRDRVPLVGGDHQLKRTLPLTRI